MTRRYAEGTKVPVAQSEAEVKTMLKAMGSDRIAVLEEEGTSSIFFQIGTTSYKISTPPLRQDVRNQDAEHRRVWRSLVLLVKAKKTAITEGITTVEREFLSDVVMPDGSTLIEHAPTMIESAYNEGGPPRLQLTGPAS
jgi:hypothetical protein